MQDKSSPNGIQHRELRHHGVLIPCKDVEAIAWDGDDLVDVVTDRRLRLDGTFEDTRFRLGYPFDRGLCVRNAGICWTIAYDNRGTKALILKNGKVHRQLNRDYYFAKAYDYPIAVVKTNNGHVVVVHCPTSYDELTFEDAESGEILGTRKSDKMEFHSRLAISPGGDSLVSAGWFWHPLNGGWLFFIGDIVGAHSDCKVDLGIDFGAEVDSVAFLGDDALVVSTTQEIVNEEVPPAGLGPMRLGMWSITEGKWARIVELHEACGPMMPWRDWVISFHDHPKAISLATGDVVHRWEGVYSGRQIGPIDAGKPAPPLLALDAVGGRFAVAGPEGVTVVTLITLG